VDEIARAFDAWRELGVGHLQVNLRPADERAVDLLVAACEKHRGER
jgi:hypothetical protein